MIPLHSIGNAAFAFREILVFRARPTYRQLKVLVLTTQRTAAEKQKSKIPNRAILQSIFETPARLLGTVDEKCA